ncbi:hypothetical protein BC938DRAFT_470795 [Jimgerdemannia flammicorona]|uniref:Galactose oxidase n=1 Tax=Jimgerdemannia flammicorona TaxID=994334 RepID=A0A433Q9J4_9FUNG|nr:hypothetical protein BC938DRAFT_470795 [Jimgerdemannia flammicorona]
MYRPLRKAYLLLLLVVAIALATISSATTTDARVAARAVLLQKTIWIYGGNTGPDGLPRNLLSRLDVSVSWETSNPPYVNYTAEGVSTAPVTMLGTLFPSADQTAFYSLDVFGLGGTSTFGKYDIATRAWYMFSTTTGQTIPNAGPAAYDNKGNTWVWGGNYPKNGYNQFVYLFDHSRQVWNTMQSPSPIVTREFHTANLLPNGMIIIIGGLYLIKNGTQWINVYADMADTPTYNTSSGVWRNNTASGFVRPRNMHTATLSPDGYTLIIYGGSAPANVTGSMIRPQTGYDETTLGDVQVLNTQKYTWSSPNTTGISPSARFGHTAVQVGWQMIVMGGSTGDNFAILPSNETTVLDTTQWSWLTNYTPTIWIDVFNQTLDFASPTTSTSITLTSTPISTPPPISTPTSPSIGVIAGISVGAVVALAAFMAVMYRLWWRRDFDNRNRLPGGPNSNRDSIQQVLVNYSNPKPDDLPQSTQVTPFNPTQEKPMFVTMPGKSFDPIRDDGSGLPLLKLDGTKPEILGVKPDETKSKHPRVKPDEIRQETPRSKPDETRPESPGDKPDDTVEPEAGSSSLQDLGVDLG